MDMQSITSKNLCSVADALAFCEAGAGKLQQVTGLVQLATRQIEQATRRIFSPQASPLVEYLTTRQTRQQRYDWEGSLEATSSISSGLVSGSTGSQTFGLMGVNVDPNTVDVRYDLYGAFGDDTLLTEANGDYVMDGDDLIILRATEYRPRALKVTYSSGFVVVPAVDGEPDRLEPVPEELRQACMMQVAFLRSRVKPDNVGFGGDRSNSAKDKVQSLPFSVSGGIAPEVASLVEPYRRVLTGRR